MKEESLVLLILGRFLVGLHLTFKFKIHNRVD